MAGRFTSSGKEVNPYGNKAKEKDHQQKGKAGRSQSHATDRCFHSGTRSGSSRVRQGRRQGIPSSGSRRKGSGRRDGLPEYKLRDIYKLALIEAKTTVLVTGAKKADSLWRRRQLSTWSMDDMGVITPLTDWSKHDVIAYLKSRNIPWEMIGDQKANASGIGLSTASLLFIYDNYPDDFKKIEEVFPYCGAVVKRRDWYGVTK